MRGGKSFPTLLVGTMTVLMIWLNEISQLATFRQVLNPNQPKFTAEDVTVTRFTHEGKRQEQLVAAQVWQYPKRPYLYLNKLTLTAFDALGKPSYVLVADTCSYNVETQSSFFPREAVMYQKNAQEQTDSTLHTSKLTIDIQRHTAQSAMPFTLYQANSVAEGVGFLYNYRLKQLHVLSKATIRYEK